ncbi:MAG: radical SAM protein [Dehalococcoidia bacterium]|nr:MAG: radical SAM protein [Dehalococcoidia bacterium]
MTDNRSHLALQYRYLSRAYPRFLLRRRLQAYPFRIHIQTHSRCNARCATCPYVNTAALREHGTMKWDVFDRLVTELGSADASSTVIFVLQHEPLMNPDLFTWVRHLKTIAPTTRCQVITNGSLLGNFPLEEIAASGVDMLSVSLNAHTRETFERINTGLDFTTVMENALRVAGDEALRQRLRVSYVVTEINQAEIGEAVAFWKSRGVMTQVKRLTNRAGALPAYESLLSSTRPEQNLIESAAAGVRRSVRRIIGCPMPFYETDILFNGDVILCCQDWNHDPVIGNIGTESLRSIWNGPALTALRHSILTHRCDQIAACRGCSIA